MSDEYEYGPGWIDVPKDGLIQLEGTYHGAGPQSFIATRYRIATPKPKRELVVGKWYLSRAGNWRRVIAIDAGAVWMVPIDNPDEASPWAMMAALDVIDWSTPPRDEAPE